MAKLLTRAFRNVEILDLSDLSKGWVVIEQVTGISKEPATEADKRFYEDKTSPSRIIPKNISGTCKIKGDIEHYLYSKSAAGSVTRKRLFEYLHYYLIRYLANNVDSDPDEMVYGRFTCQMTEYSKPNREASNITEHEIGLEFVVLQPKNQKEDVPYTAASGDATPTADYDPFYEAIVANTTLTLAAAETAIGGIVNPA